MDLNYPPPPSVLGRFQCFWLIRSPFGKVNSLAASRVRGEGPVSARGPAKPMCPEQKGFLEQNSAREPVKRGKTQ